MFALRAGLPQTVTFLASQQKRQFTTAHVLGVMLMGLAQLNKNWRITMKKVLSIVLAGMISTASLAGVPNTFISGEVATAAKFNENFTSLSNEIDDVKTAVSNVSSGSGNSSGGSSSDGSVVAKVNGVDMRVSSSQLGQYNITTPTGKTISVNAEGYPIFTWLVYESSNCSGQAYIAHHQFNEHKLKPAGHVFANPKLSTNISVIFSNNNIGYSLNNTLVKVNYRSIDYGSGSVGCRSTSGTYIASKVLPNDSVITGIDSVPLIITGIGSDLKISSTEIGEPVAGSFSVYASGTKIGATTRYPDAGEAYISVTLDGQYSDKTIYLNKDGTYSGFSGASNSSLLYLSDNCSGNAYVKVLNNGAEKFWDTNKINLKIVKNNNTYYELSAETYRANVINGSYRSYSNGQCYSDSTNFTQVAGYKIATETNAPNIPVFTPPITIEGYSEPTPYNSLPVAF